MIWNSVIERMFWSSDQLAGLGIHPGAHQRRWWPITGKQLLQVDEVVNSRLRRLRFVTRDLHHVLGLGGADVDMALASAGMRAWCYL